MSKSSRGKGPIRVVELFAGVGGFRIGLEAASAHLNGSGFKVIWSDQWEPGTKVQHASKIYVDRFGPEGHNDRDIATIPTDEIPDHDLLVGGFPCQDYSVASTLKNAQGLLGKKGVLWWQIHRILNEKKVKPAMLLLENVDRLLSSPAHRRGRDMAVVLASLDQLGYAVEWRVINAAEHGMPQRRRRVFIMGYLTGSALHDQVFSKGAMNALSDSGVLASGFRASSIGQHFEFQIDRDLPAISRNFNRKKGPTPFLNAGVMSNGSIITAKCMYPSPSSSITLGDILLDEAQVPKEYFIPRKDLRKWAYLKGAKSEQRVSASTGHRYKYSEGAMTFPDALDRPSRTIITGEGGKGPSRFKHVVQTPSGRYRRLTPVELERLNMFPDDHTKGASPSKRAFFMGNALVVGVVTRIGQQILARLKE